MKHFTIAYYFCTIEYDTLIWETCRIGSEYYPPYSEELSLETYDHVHTLTIL